MSDKKELQKKQAEVEKIKEEIKETLRAAGKAGTCRNCNETFETKKEGQKFCSERCRLEFWKKARSTNIVRELTCPVCDTIFPTADKRRRYCSPECYQKANIERTRLKYANTT